MGGWWWWWVDLDYSLRSGPFLSFEIEIRDGPGPELDNLSVPLCKQTICATQS